MQTRTLWSIVYFAAGLGLIISLFAAAEFFDAALRQVCSFNSFFSCQLIDQSGRTNTLGIPDYAWGVGGFVAILVIAGVSEARSQHRGWTYTLLAVTTAGVALSAYLLYVELALIGALCLVCAAAYVMGGVSWIGAIALARRAPEEASGNDDEAEEAAEGMESV
ncbi:MAG: vitamin K epoxide reductase family protein [Thermoplasmata archaeon]